MDTLNQEENLIKKKENTIMVAVKKVV